ncbi:MAG: T9SS type A sorting domain-containing protein, partial [Chitinophagales bacterium]
GTSTDLISLSDAIERDYFGKNVCPYKDDCGDYCTWDANFDKRNYHIRRTSYYTTYLFSEIYKQNLKYVPATFLLMKTNRNVQPTLFIDPAKQFLYVYYSNVNGETQNLILNTGNLQDFFPASAYVEFAEATITYLQAGPLYSTSGKSSLYNKYYINTCYATYNHPFEITASTESGIIPVVVTMDNAPECTGEYEENGCLSAPSYSLGYYKIPITAYYPPPKLASETAYSDVVIYPNPSEDKISVKKISTDNNVDEEITDTVLTIQGNTILQIKTFLNTTIDVSGIPAGFYQIQIMDTENNRFIKPFIKTE